MDERELLKRSQDKEKRLDREAVGITPEGSSALTQQQIGPEVRSPGMPGMEKTEWK
jgi:hypothetical protein